MKKILFPFLLLICFCTANAKYSQSCIVKYKTQNGWSKKYTVTVTFMSGMELNEATSGMRYSVMSIYAIIFWDKGEATVIKISSLLLCGTVVDQSCIRNAVLDLKGKDQDDDEWNICVNDICF